MIKCILENGNSVQLRHVTVDAILIKNNRILLIKRAENSLLEAGKYALPGGFLDRDEKAEDAVKREVKEETGYESKDVKLFRVNDNPNRKGEDRQNVDFVFIVEAGEKVSESDKEVSQSNWFGLDSLPNQEEIAFDHFENIQLYLKYLKQKFDLPVLGI